MGGQGPEQWVLEASCGAPPRGKGWGCSLFLSVVMGTQPLSPAGWFSVQLSPVLRGLLRPPGFSENTCRLGTHPQLVTSCPQIPSRSHVSFPSAISDHSQVSPHVSSETALALSISLLGSSSSLSFFVSPFCFMWVRIREYILEHSACPPQPHFNTCVFTGQMNSIGCLCGATPHVTKL